jgi:hypothetical protein
MGAPRFADTTCVAVEVPQVVVTVAVKSADPPGGMVSFEWTDVVLHLD